MIKYGFDLSQHNGYFNFSSTPNKDFCIIRTGYGSENKEKQTDKQVLNNVSKCIANNIPYGFYHYSYALNEKMAKEEAEFCLEIVDKTLGENGKNKPLYPIAYDIEDSKLSKFSDETLANFCTVFCDTIEKAGYYAVIYANRNWFLNKLDLKRLERFDKWVADWTNASDEIVQTLIPCGMRQYTVNRKLNLDLNRAFKDYPTIISNMYDRAKPAEKPDNNLKVGDVVTVTNPINYDNGTKFKLWYPTYEVLEISAKNPSRVVIGKGKVITSAIDRKYLKVI